MSTDEVSDITHRNLLAVCRAVNTAEQAMRYRRWLAEVEPFVTDADDLRSRWLRELVDQLRRTIRALQHELPSRMRPTVDVGNESSDRLRSRHERFVA